MGAAIAIGCIIAAEGLDRAEHAIDEHRFGTDAEERRRRKKDERARAKRYYGVSPDDSRYQLLAAKDGDIERLHKSLKVLEPTTATDAFNDTPLHHAAVRGHLDACKLLLQVRHELAIAVNKGGNTALHLAASTGKRDVVALLLDQLGVRMINAKGIQGFTPLHYACRDGCAAGFIQRDGFYRTGLAAQQSAAVVRLLLERGADPDIRNASGQLPVELAWCDEVRTLLPAGSVAATRLRYLHRLRALLGCNDEDTEPEALLPKDLPESFLCPITHALMVDPVETSDGHIYERHAITTWLEDHSTSPLTGLALPNKLLRANEARRMEILIELKKHVAVSV